jgi:hypothetical protein
MKRSKWTFALIALVVALAAVAASAHHYLVIRFGWKPEQALTFDNDDVKAFSLRVGEKVTLIVHDVSVPSCKATITVAGVVGTSATITPNGSIGAVKDQPFVVTGKSLGTTTFQIRVVGAGTNCTENSINDVTVNVLPDDKAAQARGEEIAKQLLKNTKSSLTSAFNTLKVSVGGLKADLKAGEISPTNAVCVMLDTYSDALNAVGTLRRSAVADFRTQLVAYSLGAGFTELDEPRAFLPGWRDGAWEEGVRDIGGAYRTTIGKIRTALNKDLPSIERTYDRPDLPFRVNYECCCCCDCCCDPYPPTLSDEFPQKTYGPRLRLDALGAIATLDSLRNPVGYLWVIGRGDATKGDVQADVVVGDGTTVTKVATVDPDGTIRFDFEGLPTGRLLNVRLKYANESSAWNVQERFIGMPRIIFQ